MHRSPSYTRRYQSPRADRFAVARSLSDCTPVLAPLQRPVKLPGAHPAKRALAPRRTAATRGRGGEQRNDRSSPDGIALHDVLHSWDVRICIPHPRELHRDIDSTYTGSLVTMLRWLNTYVTDRSSRIQNH